MVEIFKLGGIEVTKEQVQKMLIKFNEENLNEIEICDNFMLESFLNGLIIFKRGKKDTSADEEESYKIELSKVRI